MHIEQQRSNGGAILSRSKMLLSEGDYIHVHLLGVVGMEVPSEHGFMNLMRERRTLWLNSGPHLCNEGTLPSLGWHL